MGGRIGFLPARIDCFLFVKEKSYYTEILKEDTESRKVEVTIPFNIYHTKAIFSLPAK